MRALYISYFYPPLGGPASLRNVKTVKYLAEAGIDCDVVTVNELEYLYRDASLLDECREQRIFRTASLDPMALLKKSGLSRGKSASRLYLNTPERIKLRVRRLYPIDDKIGWLPYLIKAGKQALNSASYDLIYISLGPFSSGLGAYRLARSSGLPLVVDLRDYWTLLSDYDLHGSKARRAFSRYWEEKIYQQASLIVTATKGIGTDAAAAFGKELEAKLLTVYNGWDAQDFSDLPELEKPAGYILAYFGNIYARRSLAALYAALKRLRDDGSLPTETRVRLYGNFFRETLEEIADSGISDMVETVPLLEHKQALAQMRISDALILAINSSSPRGTLTSKVFEYLRAQRPILAMVPAQNEAAELLRRCGQDFICAMESADSVYHCLKRLFAEGKRDYPIPLELERGEQIKHLAERLRTLV